MEKKNILGYAHGEYVCNFQEYILVLWSGGRAQTHPKTNIQANIGIPTAFPREVDLTGTSRRYAENPHGTAVFRG